MKDRNFALRREPSGVGLGVLALVAASFWPFVNFINQNRGSSPNLGRVTLYGALVTTTFVAMAAVLGVVTRRPFARIAAPIAAFIILSFSYAAMEQAIPVRSKFVACIWVVTVGVICWLAWLVSRHRKALTAMLAALVVLVALPTASYLEFLVSASFAHTGANTEPHSYQAAFVRKPNIYFMVLDAYARADTLKEALGFDNEPFITELRNLGFFVPRRSFSNYPATNASVGSMLSMEYPVAARSLRDPGSQFHRELFGHNAVVEKLKAEGYRYILVPSGIWTKISCGGEEAVCIEKTRAVDLERAFVSLTPMQLLYQKGFFRKLLGSRAEDYLEPDDLLRPLADDLAGSPSPFFAMIHFGGIHDSIYAQDCGKGDPGGVGLYDKAATDRYVYAVRCTNRQLLPVLKAIVARDPDAVIIMTGDHGPLIGPDRPPESRYRPWTWGIHTVEDYRNLYGTMTGIRLPSSCNSLLSDDHYAVNDFRIVFACLSGTRPALLPNQTYYFRFEENRVEAVSTELLK